jgi:transcription antitermination factor NusG
MSANARIESYAWQPEQPAPHHHPLWYAAHTSANRERRVAEQLQLRQIDHFLPLYSSVRRWKDRQVELDLPLFAGYVFVRLALRDRLQVLEVPGVARLVGFSGRPAALPDEEIAALRRSVGCGMRAAPHPFLTVGRRVRILAGPLAGQEGILLRGKGNWRVVLSVQLIQRSIAVEVDTASLETVP